jgi:hypothetical protein
MDIILARAVQLCMGVFSWFYAAHESISLFPKICIKDFILLQRGSARNTYEQFSQNVIYNFLIDIT